MSRTLKLFHWLNCPTALRCYMPHIRCKLRRAHCESANVLYGYHNSYCGFICIFAFPPFFHSGITSQCKGDQYFVQNYSQCLHTCKITVFFLFKYFKLYLNYYHKFSYCYQINCLISQRRVQGKRSRSLKHFSPALWKCVRSEKKKIMKSKK